MLATQGRWACTVSLRGGGLTGAFSPEISSKDMVGIWIRRAQARILCPHLSADIFKDKNREELNDLSDWTRDAKVRRFSDTVIEVKINDPEGTDLVFIDLPGTGYLR